MLLEEGSDVTAARTDTRSPVSWGTCDGSRLALGTGWFAQRGADCMDMCCNVPAFDMQRYSRSRSALEEKLWTSFSIRSVLKL